MAEKECGFVVRVGHGAREMKGCLLGAVEVDVNDALRTRTVMPSRMMK